MNKIRTLLFVLAAGWALSPARAQSTQPVVTQQPGFFTASATSMNDGATLLTIDLRNYFHLPEVKPPLVLFQSNLGDFVVQLFPDDAPRTVENFLRYVDGGLYNGTIIHRSETNFVIQGGGYRITNPTDSFLIEQVPSFTPIKLEYKLANTLGTLSMARTSPRRLSNGQYEEDPYLAKYLNSATSQFFLNTVDNTNNLGPSNLGGYAVFGKVIGNGMTIVDNMAAVGRYNFGSGLATLPLLNYSQTDYAQSKQPLRNQFLQFPNVRRLDLYPESNDRPSLLRFQLGANTTPGVADITITGSILRVNFPPNQNASAQVEVVASSTEGKTAVAIAQCATSDAAFVLGESTRISSTNWYAWLDFVYDAQFPWIYLFQKKLWLYCAGPHADNLFLWSPEIGWLWTSRSYYPFVYAFEASVSPATIFKTPGWIELPTI